MPGIDACAPDSSGACDWATAGCVASGGGTDGSVTGGWGVDGCADGVWVALGAGVPVCDGDSDERMPGISACPPGSPGPDVGACDGCTLDGGETVGCVVGGCAAGVWEVPETGAGARTDRIPGTEASAPDCPA